MSRVQELLSQIEIAAPPVRVWSLVTDLPRMAAWSPQVVRTVVFGGPVRQGSRFVNLNRRGLAHWPTSGKVVRFEPHTDFAFRISENYTVWSFHLEPRTAEDGALHTRVTQRREVPSGISRISRSLIEVAMRGQQEFEAELSLGMAQTLRRLKTEAESSRA